MLPNSIYSTVEPTANVTFQPDDWNTPKTLYISASARTLDRPVCSSGRRYCNALKYGNDLDFIHHAVHSHDQFYAALSLEDLPSVTVQVSVVHDSTDPAVVSVARFGDLLNSIFITFDKETNRAGLSGTFACSMLLLLTAEQAETLFGRGSSCSFVQQDKLKVTFGEEPTVTPGASTFALRDNKIQAIDDIVSLYSMNTTFRIISPEVAIVPGIILKASAKMVGVCDNLILDGSTSTGSGGRKMDYEYSVSWVGGEKPATSISNLSKAFNLANDLNDGHGLYRVTLKSEIQPTGTVFDVTLRSMNFLQQFDSATVRITKLQVPVPSVHIAGRNVRSDATSSTVTEPLTRQRQKPDLLGSYTSSSN